MASFRRIQRKSLSLVALLVCSACTVPVDHKASPNAQAEVADVPPPLAPISALAPPRSAPPRHAENGLGFCATRGGTLADACTDRVCPPALGTAEFREWCAEVTGPGARPVIASRCEGFLIVTHGDGVDCAAQWAYNEESGALVGVMDVVCGSLQSTLAGSDTCIPPCCVDGTCGTRAPSPCAP